MPARRLQLPRLNQQSVRMQGGFQPALPARGADARQLHRPLIESEAKPVPQVLRRCRNTPVLRLDDDAALAADEELDDMGVVRMPASDEGPRGLKSMDQAVLHQEVEATIDAGGGDCGACGGPRSLPTLTA